MPPDPAQEQPVDILYKIIIIKTEKNKRTERPNEIVSGQEMKWPSTEKKGGKYVETGHGRCRGKSRWLLLRLLIKALSADVPIGAQGIK